MFRNRNTLFVFKETFVEQFYFDLIVSLHAGATSHRLRGTSKLSLLISLVQSFTRDVWNAITLYLALIYVGAAMGDLPKKCWFHELFNHLVFLTRGLLSLWALEAKETNPTFRCSSGRIALSWVRVLISFRRMTIHLCSQ